MDLVRIEAFAYNVSISHLTTGAMSARAIHENIMEEELAAAKAGAGNAEATKEGPDKTKPMPTQASMVETTPRYSMMLLLPTDGHEGIREMARLEVLRRFPQIGILEGADFEPYAIRLTVHNVALLGKVFGDAHALADLEATPRG